MDNEHDSFFAGNGWNDQSELENNSTFSRRQNFDRVPLPVSIDTILHNLSRNEEKCVIGSYTFNTVKLIGIVIKVEMIEEDSCIAYSLIDPSMEDVKMPPTFTVIRYQGVDSIPEDNALSIGNFVQAVGKIRLFNDTLSLISFDIRAIKSNDEIENFEMETKLANLYYSKNIPDRSASEIENLGITFLSPSAPLRNYLNTQFIPFRNNTQTTSSQTQSTSRISETSGSSGLMGQSARIYECIKLNSSAESGVSIEEIRDRLQPDMRFLLDLNYLLGEGLIYNTIDDDHFAVI